MANFTFPLRSFAQTYATRYLLFTGLRLRWYIRASGDLLARHWQWFLIAGLIVPGPPIVGLFFLPALVLEAVISHQPDLLWQLVGILAVQLTALLWIIPQRRLYSGGGFMDYASTLPLSKSLCLGVDLTLLIVADTLAIVPAFIATAHALATQSPDRVFRVCALWVLLGSACVVQMVALERRAIAFLSIALADVALGSSLVLPVGGLRLPLLALALAGTIAGLLIRGPAKRFNPMSLTFMNIRRTSSIARVLGHYSPPFLIQCKALAARPGPAVLRLNTAIVLALAVDRLIAIFNFDSRSLPTVILALAAISLILSGVYRTLRDAHAPMQAYLGALPISPRYWLTRDTAFVLLLGVAPLCILLWPLVAHDLSPLFVLFVLAAAFQALLALQRLPLTFGERNAVLYRFILAASWSVAAMAATPR
ncbi:MAG TPA: hypothetical protein VGL35_05030 [Rhizomicrobium sp.]